MSAGKMMCDCGCGVEEHFARLQTIEIQGAIDESLRQTFVAKRFLVRKACYEPFIEELKAMKLLQDYVYRFTRAQKTHWWTRAWRMRRIVRMQFVVHVRNRGLDFAKKASIRSGLLFVCSPRISGLLWRYWSWADKHELVWRRWNAKSEPQTQIPETSARSDAARPRILQSGIQHSTR
jgi:hypothetical protein